MPNDCSLLNHFRRQIVLKWRTRVRLPFRKRKGAEAAKEWEKLAKDTDDLYGAKSAYYLGQYYFDSGQTKKARNITEKLVDSNTPHSYWLARGYILLSDIYKKQGNDFEAREYLKSLKENYPGLGERYFYDD